MTDTDKQPTVRISEATRFNFSSGALMGTVALCFAAGAWATALQVQMANLSTTLAEVQADLKELRHAVIDSRVAGRER
ncbi:MAG: hypothetical protein RL030_1805 [Pseudomonadota bacterium]|jgi:hypothetical protein